MAYFTRSRARSEHKAAGVLPFSLHEGAVVVLLGGEPCKTGPKGKVWRTMWRDFGGCREAADADGEATAAREFAEETLGLFGSPGVDAASVALAAADMEARLHAPGMAIKVVHALKRGAYHFFITQLPFVAPLMFRLATQQNAATGAVPGAEKSAFAWVPLRALLECVAVAAPRYFLETHAQVCGGPDTPPALRCGRRRFQLHPCFASSLRMAQRLGLEELIGRAQELPLPPPPPLLPSSPAGAVAVPEPAALVRSGAAAEEESAVVDFEPAAAPSLAVATETAAQETGEPEAEAAAAAEGDDGGSDADRAVGAGLQDSLAYLLARQDVAAALRGGSPPPPALGPADGSPPGGGGQGQQLHSLPACRAGWASPAAAAAPSSSSLAPASSLDTASSLRESQRKAAVEQVVQQIEANSQRRAPHRLSRKQRLKRRRQRLQRQADAAAAAAAAAAGGEPAVLALAAPAAARPGAALHDSMSPGPGSTVDGEDEGLACPASAPPAAPPPHWQHAMRELDAAFQPRLRLQKRLRLVVGAAG